MLASEAEAERGLAQGELIREQHPANFDRSVDRGETPSILVDATDPAAIGNAAAALAALSAALDRDLPPVRQPHVSAPPFQFVVHARYNPEQLTVLNIVPGLICVVLLISTLLVTALSITRERERGTMENLLAMPVRPIEVMLAKIVPISLLAVSRWCSSSPLPLCSSSCRFGTLWRCSLSLWACSLPAILRLGSRFRQWRQTRCRRSSLPSLPFCRRFCFRTSCSRSRACRSGRNGQAKSSPRRTRCGSRRSFRRQAEDGGMRSWTAA